MSSASSTAFKQMRRTPYQAFGVILVLFTTFFLSYLYSYIFFGSQFLLKYFETRPQVIAFFKPTATDADISTITTEMQGKSYVQSVKLVSKEEALASYKQDNSKDPLLADLVTADVFPASIEVSGKEITTLPEIQTDLSKHTDVIEEVVYQKDVIDTLAKWTHTIRIVGIGMISVLGLTALLIVTIIISMKVLVKKQEIAVMRLLGATTFYVQAPFLVEGLFYGFTGSLLAWAVAVTLLLYSTPWLVNFLGDIPLLPVPPIFLMAQLGAGLVAGLLLGVISSSLALRRYIK